MTDLVNDSFETFEKSLGEKDDSLLLKIKCPIVEFFDEQKHIDRARKDLSKQEIQKVLRLYLGHIDFPTLRDKIKTHRRNFERGFGRDRLNHLQLLVDLKIILEEKKPRRGLLAS